ncbi:hypothetical protein U9M48_002754, partial [Paspalum notatum var. saurae]
FSWAQPRPTKNLPPPLCPQRPLPPRPQIEIPKKSPLAASSSPAAAASPTGRRARRRPPPHPSPAPPPPVARLPAAPARRPPAAGPSAWHPPAAPPPPAALPLPRAPREEEENAAFIAVRIHVRTILASFWDPVVQISSVSLLCINIAAGKKLKDKSGGAWNNKMNTVSLDPELWNTEIMVNSK